MKKLFFFIFIFLGSLELFAYEEYLVTGIYRKSLNSFGAAVVNEYGEVDESPREILDPVRVKKGTYLVSITSLDHGFFDVGMGIFVKAENLFDTLISQIGVLVVESQIDEEFPPPAALLIPGQDERIGKHLLPISRQDTRTDYELAKIRRIQEKIKATSSEQGEKLPLPIADINFSEEEFTEYLVKPVSDYYLMYETSLPAKIFLWVNECYKNKDEEKLHEKISEVTSLKKISENIFNLYGDDIIAQRPSKDVVIQVLYYASTRVRSAILGMILASAYMIEDEGVSWGNTILYELEDISKKNQNE